MGAFRRCAVSVGGRLQAPARLAVLLALLGRGTAFARGVDVSVGVDAGRYEVHAEFSTTAPPGLVWAVLTDYEGIPAFVSSIRQSTLEKRAGGELRLHQVASAGSFPFRRTVRVTLDVREEPQARIEFVDVLGRDFKSYAGSWSVSADSGATAVRYALALEPRSGVPGWLGRSIMSHTAGDLLADVRAEIERRAARR